MTKKKAINKKKVTQKNPIIEMCTNQLRLN